MKKVEVEKLVSKSIVITAVLLCLILGTTYIETGYFSHLSHAATSVTTFVVSILFAVAAVAMVILGIYKNSKYYFYATISAVIAIFFMMLKINYEIKKLEFMFAGITIKFYDMSIVILALSILVTWVRATVKLVKE